MKRFGYLTATLAFAAVASMSAPVIAQEQKQPASPRGTASGTIGAAKIEISYGRPSKRDRQIWGGPLLDVPSDQVWRLGANEATTLKTSAPITIGSVSVPAGEHTLYFFHPAEGGEKLIINKQTGQWGTDYDEKQDVGRADLKMEKLTAPVEQLTISIEPQSGGNGVLKIAWDDRAYSAAISAK
jgi:DUF2911 family protein